MQGHNGGVLYHNPKTGNIAEATTLEELRDMKRRGYVKTTPKNIYKRKVKNK